ncbi:MAG: hypothetical protein ACOC1P_02890 [Minisyncoccales bacterium]
MAIEFEKEKKRQKYLIAVAIIIIIVTGIVLWRGYVSEMEIAEPTPKKETTPRPKFSMESLPQIDFNVLSGSLLSELKDYPTIEEIDKEEVGRENPFLPY